jgi:hypothetical protein
MIKQGSAYPDLAESTLAAVPGSVTTEPEEKSSLRTSIVEFETHSSASPKSSYVEARGLSVTRPVDGIAAKPFALESNPSNIAGPELNGESNATTPRQEDREQPVAPDVGIPVLPMTMDKQPISEPVKQIVRNIEAIARPMMFTAAPEEGPQRPPTELRVLRIALRPVELGDVELTLRRSGEELRVHIAVSRPSTAERLQRDLTVLTDRVGDLLSGSSQQAVTIVVQPLEAMAIPTAPPEPGPPGNWSATNFSSQPEGGSRRQPSGKDDGRNPVKGHGRNDETGSRLRIASGRIV